jgi:AcrR family transcriptional regulator
VTVASENIPFDPAVQPGPGAKVRILQTADVLFYAEGIHTVGIDRLISQSKVTKATFYKHFGSKDHLILLYIEARHLAEVNRLETLLAQHPKPEAALRAIVADTVTDIAAPGFRGDAFLNAATEFSEAGHPVRSVVLAHREWLTGFLADVLHHLGHPMPGDAADDLMLARDGAMGGAYAGDPIAATASFSRITDHIITGTTA